MKNKTQKNSALTLVEVMVVLAILGLLAAIAIPIINNSNKPESKILRCLPPGTIDLNMMPEPLRTEQHLGHDWIIAKGKTNYQMVVYYPRNQMKISSSRYVQVDQFLNPAAQGDMQSLEVSVTRKSPEKNHEETECFTLMPLVNGSKVILLGIDDEDMDFLKDRLLKNLQKKVDEPEQFEAPSHPTNQ